MLHIHTLFFIFQTIPFAASLNFSFHSFNPNEYGRITYERDAYSADGAIQLTKNLQGASLQASIGRATYFEPMQLWDKASKNVTDFTTHFSFVINSQKRTSYGDGFAFFLAPNGTTTPVNAKEGGAFGLTNDDQPLNTTVNQFVAVEFDIFPNGWDPGNYDEHVGIDIDSVQSNATANWSVGNSIKEGWKNEAWISYNASSNNFTVVFTGYDSDNRTINQSIYYIIDLSDYLPDLVTFGFSAATGRALALHSIDSWDFNSSLELDVDENKTNKSNPWVVVGLVVGGSAFICGCGLALFSYWKKRNREEHEDDLVFDDSMDDEFERGTGPKKFTYNALARATNNFAQTEKLGEGGFGGVYRGFLRELNCYVAVKRVSRGSRQGIKEYASEVKIISRLRHKNLVQLIGWCHENRELLLVYEYMPNGSLDTHLFKGKSLLAWEVRYKIAQGLASALLYLHEEWEQCVVHRDIKCSNVMLDSSFNTKLGDFGLARLVDHGKGAQTTVLAGTMGYMAPECFVTGKASRESDVFSFGVVALEIACGRKPIDPNAEESRIRLVEWVWTLYGIGKLVEAADPKLSGEFDEQEMQCLMIVGLWCAHPDSTLRPSISQAIHVLNLQAPLPVLPIRMPVASYSTPENMPLPSPSLASGATVSSSSQTQSSGYSNNTNSSSFSISSPPDSVSAALLHTR